jgi:hypothetical protein
MVGIRIDYLGNSDEEILGEDEDYLMDEENED